MKTMNCLAAGIAALVATGLAQAGDVRGDDVIEVVVRDHEFVPQHVTAKPGQTIRWVWEDGLHTVTSGEICGWDGWFHAPIDQYNPQWEWTVPQDQKPGSVIDYHCLPHCSHDMDGTITVKGGDSQGDLNGDGTVNVSDMLQLLGLWGDCPKGEKSCEGDLNSDGAVNVSDLLILLNNWG